MKNEFVSNFEEGVLDAPFCSDECGDTLWDVVLQQAEDSSNGVKPSNSLGTVPPDRD